MEINKIDEHSITSQQDAVKGVQSLVQNKVEKVHQENKQRNVSEVKGTYGKISREEVQHAVDEVNGFLEPVRRNLKYELHDKLDQYYVTVVDTNTEEVIKEIPPKKMLDMYAEMAELMGLLVDKKI